MPTHQMPTNSVNGDADGVAPRLFYPSSSLRIAVSNMDIMISFRGQQLTRCAYLPSFAAK
eukprot:scaffold373_cov78-Skeletonema_dohrnii-CCMP3373.AAC.4